MKQERTIEVAGEFDQEPVEPIEVGIRVVERETNPPQAWSSWNSGREESAAWATGPCVRWFGINE
jgi:hypothetical protein